MSSICRDTTANDARRQALVMTQLWARCPSQPGRFGKLPRHWNFHIKIGCAHWVAAMFASHELLVNVTTDEHARSNDQAVR